MFPSDKVMETVRFLVKEGFRVTIDPSEEEHGPDILIETDEDMLAVTWAEIDNNDGSAHDIATALGASHDMDRERKN